VGITGSGGSLIEHWTGNVWSRVPGLDVGGLGDVKAAAPNDVWAAGLGGIIHWDGATWAQSPAPSGAVALAANAPGDVWAVGVNILRYADTQRFSDVPRSDTF